MHKKVSPLYSHWVSLSHEVISAQWELQETPSTCRTVSIWAQDSKDGGKEAHKSIRNQDSLSGPPVFVLPTCVDD